MKRIAVYCGSNKGARPEYAAAAHGLGALLARKKIELVYGGGMVGLMGVVADAALKNGGHVIGVIPVSYTHLDVYKRQNYKLMQEVAELMQPFFDKLGVACFVQGTGTPRSTMLEKFKDDTDSVLFGTDSFWMCIRDSAYKHRGNLSARRTRHRLPKKRRAAAAIFEREKFFCAGQADSRRRAGYSCLLYTSKSNDNRPATLCIRGFHQNSWHTVAGIGGK